MPSSDFLEMVHPGFIYGVRVVHLFRFLCCICLFLSLGFFSSCVLYVQCGPSLWIVNSWLSLRFSLTFWETVYINNDMFCVCYKHWQLTYMSSNIKHYMVFSTTWLPIYIRDCHDISKILLKVALNTINQPPYTAEQWNIWNFVYFPFTKSFYTARKLYGSY